MLRVVIFIRIRILYGVSRFGSVLMWIIVLIVFESVMIKKVINVIVE